MKSGPGRRAGSDTAQAESGHGQPCQDSDPYAIDRPARTNSVPHTIAISTVWPRSGCSTVNRANRPRTPQSRSAMPACRAGAAIQRMPRPPAPRTPAWRSRPAAMKHACDADPATCAVDFDTPEQNGDKRLQLTRDRVTSASRLMPPGDCSEMITINATPSSCKHGVAMNEIKSRQALVQRHRRARRQ